MQSGLNCCTISCLPSRQSAASSPDNQSIPSMPAFLNKVFKRENSAAAKKAEADAAAAAKPVEIKYQDAWFRTSVTPEDVQELLRGCTNEIKHRGLYQTSNLFQLCFQDA